MALTEKRVQLDVKHLKDNLTQAIKILEDLDLSEDPDVTLKSVGTFAMQAAQDAFILSGVMKEKTE